MPQKNLSIWKNEAIQIALYPPFFVNPNKRDVLFEALNDAYDQSLIELSDSELKDEQQKFRSLFSNPFVVIDSASSTRIQAKKMNLELAINKISS